ncbi:hypothetical protein ACYPKM_01295 [Pseudomonas aeruginosa]
MQALEGYFDSFVSKAETLEKKIGQDAESDLRNGKNPARVFMSALEYGAVGEAMLIYRDYGPFKLGLTGSEASGFYLTGIPGGEGNLINHRSFNRSYSNNPKAGYVALVLMEAAGLFDGESNSVVCSMLGSWDADLPDLKFGSLSSHLTPGDIPVISGQQVERPELYLAARSEGDRPVGQVFPNMLCWVADADFALFRENFRPFQNHQALELSNRCGSLSPFSELDGLLAQDPSLVGVEGFDMRITLACDRPTIDDARMIQDLCPRLTAYGLSTLPGHVLCAVPMSFIETLPHALPDQRRLKGLTSVLRHRLFGSVTRKFATTAKLGSLDPDVPSNRDCAHIMRLIQNVDGAALLVGQAIPKPILSDFIKTHQLLRKSSFSLGEYLRVKDELGVNTRDVVVELQTEQVQELYEKGHKFDPGTKVTLDLSITSSMLLNSSEEDNLMVCDRAFRQYMEMSDGNGVLNGFNLNSNRGEILESLGRGISRPSESSWDRYTRDGNVILKHFVQYKGLGYFAAHAKTDYQWKALALALGLLELKPLWDRVPRQVKLMGAASTLSL